ncbi:MAG TPA: hypothetical protein VMI92_00870 [Steroidobacteraceae bacterium]|nr:hypothetical protein [Steroidobacteraceae bacterium]
MRKFIIAVSATACSVAALAQEPFQCVNPDVLNALVFNARVESRLVAKRTLPDVADGYAAPADFTLIGSVVRGANVLTSVGYKTALEARKAFDNLLQFMNAEGWQPEFTPRTPPAVTVAGPPPLAVNLCRNGERRNFLIRDIEGVRYAMISGYETSPPRACNVPAPQQVTLQGMQTNPLAAINALHDSLPQLSFPETARMIAPPPGAENLNTDAVFSVTRIESPDTAATLAGLLSPQLVAQNWSNDAKWSGALSTGSTWIRKTDDGKKYWGTLEILSLGKGIYNVRFTLASWAR